MNHRRQLTKLAARKGVPVRGVSNWRDLAERLAAFWGIAVPDGKGAKRFCYEGMEARGWIAERPEKPHRRKSDPIKGALWDTRSKNAMRTFSSLPIQEVLVLKAAREAFYASAEWRQVRDKVLAVYGRRCMACSRSECDGVAIHVDHIRPLKRFWALRLDPDNLQILCADCNRAKASRSEIDLRPVTYERAVAAFASGQFLRAAKVSSR